MKKFVRSLFFLIVFFALTSCEADQKDKTIVSISIDQTTVPESLEVGEVDVSVIKLVILYDDDSTSVIPLSEAMFSQEDLIKLTSTGYHTLTITYAGITTTLQLAITNDGLTLQLQMVYQLALESGFEGTYEDWLNSVKGPKGDDGKSITLRVNNNQIEWTYIGESNWNILIGLNDLKGADGKLLVLRTTTTAIEYQYEGQQTWTTLVSFNELKGNDGKQVIFRVGQTHLQYQYEGDTAWINLLDLSLIKGINGTDGIDGKKILLDVSDSHIRYQYEGDSTWINLVSLDLLKGTTGLSGHDGKSIELEVTATHLVYRLEGSTEWTNLIELSLLKGSSGKDGLSILEATLNEQGELILVMSDESFINVGVIKGKDGNDGKSSFDFYVEAFPLYKGTQNEWIRALAKHELLITLILNLDNGSLNGESDVLEVLNGEVFDLPIPMKPEVSFEGYYFDEAFNEPFDLEVLYEMGLNQIVIYAKYTSSQLTYEVRFLNGSTIHFEQTIQANMSVNQPDDPIKEGYEFLGYSTTVDGDLVVFPYLVTNDVIFHAVYRLIEETKDNHLQLITKEQNATSITVEVWLKGNVYFSAYDFRVFYDQTHLTVTSVTEGFVTVVNYDTTPGVILFNYSGVSRITTEKLLLTVTFTFNTKTSSQISLGVIDFYALNEVYLPVAVAYETSSLSVEP